jgi:4-diphosphocytidyl-2-C-methyl-D-erythritol kinase
VNLSLFLGGVRADGRHELVTLFESVSLADELLMTTRASHADPASDSDEVVCAGVEGPNLAGRALERLRARGWRAPPVRLEIRKRIPVAAGMAGGSADAAATLRLAATFAPVASDALAELAASLGADVPSQLSPGVSVGTGAGDVIEHLGALAPHAFLILAQPRGLSTAEVYRVADRLGLPRSAEELATRRRQLLRAPRAGAESPYPPADGALADSASSPANALLTACPSRPADAANSDPASSPPNAALGVPSELLVNDLEPAALSLCPQIDRALQAARDAGAEHAMVCGSGPTVMGLFWGQDAAGRAAAATFAIPQPA